MFLVRFIRKPEDEETVFAKEDSIIDHIHETKEKALAELKMYESDASSDDFCRIAVLDDEKNIVLRILLFDVKGRNEVVLSDGDVVRLRPGFCQDNRERGYLFALSNINELSARGQISCLNGKTAFPVSELVGLSMIAPVGTTVADILSSAER